MHGRAFVAIKFGGLPMLLPIYFTVCHRMIPVLHQHGGAGLHRDPPHVGTGRHLVAGTRAPVAGAAARLPVAVARGRAAGAAVRRAADRLVAARPDPRVAARACSSASRGCRSPSRCTPGKAPGYAISGEFVLGRAPAHALFIGFFGSLLVAMVTRVTQGHSGRPLVLGARRGDGLRDRATGRGDCA